MTRRLFEKAKLLELDLSLAKLDIEKAFDKVRHVSIVDALRSRGAPPLLFLAVAVEYVSMGVELFLDEISMGEFRCFVESNKVAQSHQ